jgi:hypothetical protein
METTYTPPITERINFRLIAFAAMVAFLIGYPAYWYIDSVVSGGIKDRGDYVEVDLKAMSSFPFDSENGTIEDVPQRWRALDGRRVVLVGEMWAPYSTSSRLKEFELVYSIQQCCFSGPPQIQHFVQSRVVNDDGVVSFHSGQVRVVGTLRVDVERAEGRVVSVYRLEVESVEPA